MSHNLRPPPPPPFRSKERPAPAPVAMTWAGVLAAVGYPLDVVVLDFETYFDPIYGLKQLSHHEYIQDKRFEVLGLARLHVDGRNPHIDVAANSYFEVGEECVERYINYLRTTYGPDLSRCTIVMQNANFDASVLALRYNLNPKYLIDTVNLARSFHSRSKHGLKDLAKKFGLPEKGETANFVGCSFRPRWKPVKEGPPERYLAFSDDQVKAMCGYAQRDAEITFKLLEILLPKLSNPATELRLQDHTLRLYTQPTLVCDLEHGQKLITGMQAELATLIDATGQTQEEISGNISFDRILATALILAGDDPMAYTKVMKSGTKFELAKDDPGLKRLQQHPDHRVRILIAARTGIKSWPNHVSRVSGIMAMSRAVGGAMPIPLRYWGAHTGRFSGSEGINAQNLAKRGHPLVVGVRGLFAAAPGQELVIVDLAAIEARVLAWIAGQDDLVAKFAAGAEIYCGFAEKVLGTPVRKPRKDGIPAVEAKHEWARNKVGKVGILGCGYGMGKDRLFEYADGAVTSEMAAKIVEVYRAEHRKITTFWNEIEKAFIYTAKYRTPCSIPWLSFYATDDVYVVIRLPNGRTLNYHRVKLEQDSYGRARASVYNDVTHKHEPLWGGVLTENVVQAISRDVLTDAMLRLEDLGHHTALHVHDELVLTTATGNGPAVLAIAVKEMSRTPAWGAGLPLGAEGVISERYGLH